ncbi:basic salivary proline-rich protein 3-like [Dipodomys spectabilis]|uniref:basic salivary proline-rich protein 3-like n=1 Tax=Dipodomys spectabilis TaxID=105255 RepID=UPI001C53A5E1|nr:basic salivary proline-rich protein 3-like [Dipodomys spectabilis]
MREPMLSFFLPSDLSAPSSAAQEKETLSLSVHGHDRPVSLTSPPNCRRIRGSQQHECLPPGSRQGRGPANRGPPPGSALTGGETPAGGRDFGAAGKGQRGPPGAIAHSSPPEDPGSRGRSSGVRRRLSRSPGGREAASRLWPGYRPTVTRAGEAWTGNRTCCPPHLLRPRARVALRHPRGRLGSSPARRGVTHRPTWATPARDSRDSHAAGSVQRAPGARRPRARTGPATAPHRPRHFPGGHQRRLSGKPQICPTPHRPPAPL